MISVTSVLLKLIESPTEVHCAPGQVCGAGWDIMPAAARWYATHRITRSCAGEVALSKLMSDQAPGCALHSNIKQGPAN
jgi:hypothetical protein